jgi:ribosomal protein S18 acetylase RimI-like enzyme
MLPADLAAVETLAAALHPDYPERPEVFAERLALAPEGCRVLEGPAGLLGYAVTHPWAGPPPALDRLLGALPVPAGDWHIHDIALDPAARGAGHAGAVLQDVLALAAARGCGWATLVAVAGKAAYWTPQGFAPAGAAPGYGSGAVLMRRALGPPAA